ncbi:hypothetical protein DV711_09125 [Motiliproteus coralliicola]|uniref:Uncharacterized protein n=1 Tax=Motiliproteus coralliicola TaxID=2283196 RepID=A0A369WKY5_9GAMM|nr:hypothetical protein DV711_09125 [Motiliproteus coralliicola]
MASYSDLVSDTEADVEEQARLALDTLTTASNKPLSSSVIDEVNSLLGISEPNAVVDAMKSLLEDPVDEPVDDEDPESAPETESNS